MCSSSALTGYSADVYLPFESMPSCVQLCRIELLARLMGTISLQYQREQTSTSTVKQHCKCEHSMCEKYGIGRLAARCVDNISGHCCVLSYTSASLLVRGTTAAAAYPFRYAILHRVSSS
jgi:hypothetical protein